MDHMMPVMDGIVAANILRASGYSHPIVALTANAISGQAEMFYRTVLTSLYQNRLIRVNWTLY
jgi:CheY-like chemotaxis protein